MLEGIFGNKSAEKVLLYLEQYGEGYARAMAETFEELSLSMALAQLRRFEAAGLLVSRQVGRTLLFGWNPRYPFLAEVRVGMPVSRTAKWKTTIQMLTLGFLIVGGAGPDFGPLSTTEIGVIGLWAAAALTLVTGFDYLMTGLRYIAATDCGPEDKDRQAGSG